MNGIFGRRLPVVVCLLYGTFAGSLGADAEQPGLDAQQLGITESVLHYCGPIDPDAAKQIKNKVAQLVQGVSEAALAKARESDAYKKAYERVSSFTAQVDTHNAKKVCTTSWPTAIEGH